jgi:hypothetical protein
MELGDDYVAIDRQLSALDREVVAFTSVLDALEIDYVIVSGYVSILTGRSRSTEDVDVILEPLSESELERLADRFESVGYWGMAMPLDRLPEILSEGDRIRIAKEDQVFPNFECWLAATDIDREALAASISARLGDHEIAISSIELQIAYKLSLAAKSGSLTGKDFEDALHLFLTFEGEIKNERLEHYVNRLEVEETYAELERACRD